ncbi:MAG: hypothetical protein GY761_18285 [Hyphomicrobiales bacterium]|nr:hypothetical protein [Hyphomicrobiales bacterium]
MIEKLIAQYDLLNHEIDALIQCESISEIEILGRQADKVLDDIIHCECNSDDEAQTKFKFLINLMKLEYFESRKEVIGDELIAMFDKS